MLKLIFSLFFSFLFLNSAHSAEVESYIQKAKQAELHTKDFWLSVVRYDKNDIFSGYSSKVLSADFFLAENGRKEPEAELYATIKGFYEPVVGNIAKNMNLHPQCRFRARFLWLDDQLKFKNLPKVECLGFKRWSFNNNVVSVSLVFATGYLENPASFFGHPVLKFNLPRDQIPSDLLDVSVNYGAITPDEENPFIYAFKGVAGGYYATFSHRKFYYNSHNYSETELRDMWEYEINLSPREVEYIVAHTWEVLGKHFSYHFLDNNCASGMADLFELVLDNNLLPDYVPWAIPYSLFDSLAHQKRPDGSPIVKQMKYIPSRQAELIRKYNNLEAAERKSFHNFIDKQKFADGAENLNNMQKARSLSTLLDYYAFRAVGQGEENPYKEEKRKLFVQRLKLPPMKLQWPEFNAEPPTKGQRAVLTGISGIHSEEFGSGLELRLKPAYYDFIALEAGRPPFSSVSIFDFKFVFLEDQFWLKSVEIIGIDTLAISQTGLPGDGGIAWRANFGFEDLNLACNNCNVFKLEVGVGKAVKIGAHSALFAMLDSRYQTSRLRSSHISLTPTFGALLEFTPYWKILVEAGQQYFVDKDPYDYSVVTWENRFGISRDWDIRATYRKNVGEHSLISINKYW